MKKKMQDGGKVGQPKPAPKANSIVGKMRATSPASLGSNAKEAAAKRSMMSRRDPKNRKKGGKV